MFGIFTNNFDAMKEATNNKTKSLGNLENKNKITQAELSRYFGGKEQETFEKKKVNFFSRFFHNPSPCEGDLPQ